MDTVSAVAGPVATLISTGASVASSFMNKPKMPNVKEPTPAPTPVMPAKDDATARAAALTAIAKRSSQKGRQSTNLYEKEALGG